MTFLPLSPSPDLMRRLGDDGGWTPLASPGFPGPQIVRAGDVLAVGLLTNDAWGQRLTEYIAIEEPSRAEGFAAAAVREFTFSAGAPRDFTLDDVELRLTEPRVSINGRFEESASGAVGDGTGRVVWLYIPGRGRFVFSAVPLPRFGFSRAGEVRGSVLRFTAAGDTYSIISAARIAPGSSAYNVYVLHQPAWVPAYANANRDTVHVGSADRVEYVVGG